MPKWKARGRRVRIRFESSLFSLFLSNESERLAGEHGQPSFFKILFFQTGKGILMKCSALGPLFSPSFRPMLPFFTGSRKEEKIKRNFLKAPQFASILLFFVFNLIFLYTSFYFIPFLSQGVLFYYRYSGIQERKEQRVNRMKRGRQIRTVLS